MQQALPSSRPYRLSLDLGSTSLGWAVLDLKRDEAGVLVPFAVRKLGVRLFSDGRDPQDKTSLAVSRRVARQMRRRRDRYLVRRRRLLAALIRHGLMPAEPAARKALAQRDPYELRERGLTQPLTPHEFGRVLFHLNQRRGYAENRRTGSKDDPNEAGKIKAGVTALNEKMAEAGKPTLGAFLVWRRQQKEGVRARLEGEGNKAAYLIYPARAMLEAEFSTLWAFQAGHHPGLLTEAVREDLHHRIFFQRPLKPVKVGKCTFFPNEERAPRALPSAQLFRLYQELANLRLVYPTDRSEQALTPPQRDKLLGEIRAKSRKALTWDKLRQLLKLGSEVKFNLESEKRRDFKGDETGALLASEKCFGKGWRDLSLADQDEIVTNLLNEPDEQRLIDWLIDRWGLAPENAAKVADTRLPDFHAAVGRTALAQLLPILAQETMMDPETRLPRHLRYDEAVLLLGWHHSDFRPGVLLTELPYYGSVMERYVAFGSGEPDDSDEKRLGRIANPTVHIGLNQLRHLVNAVIAKYGHPHEIVVELARDIKRSAAERKEKEREQAQNQKRNEEWRQTIRDAGAADTPHTLMKLRIWTEQKQGDIAVCPYTGEVINLTKLLSPAVDIDHILPFSKTLDDGIANKVVCVTRANRQKRNRTPFEAFGRDNPEAWAEIMARVEDLPKNKRWRFAPDALERMEAEGGFEARQLNDTRYLSRVAREYLLHVCTTVRASPGRLTSLLRARWGLNSLLSDDNRKERSDHRHHAIDAVVIGCIDQGLVQRVATARAREEAEEGLQRLLKDAPEPWTGFRDHLAARIESVRISHRPEHSTNGELHEQTAYGLIDPQKHDGYNLVRRKMAADLSEKEVATIRDPDLREALELALARHRGGGLDYKSALPKALADVKLDQRWEGLRHIRIMTKESKPIPIADKKGADGKDADGEGVVYKGLIAGQIHHIDLFADITPGGKGRWSGRATTVYEAQRDALRDDKGCKTDRAPPPQAEPGERFVMRLHKGDYLVLDHDGRERLMLVITLEPSSRSVVVIEPHRARQDRSLHTKISFDQLRKRRARRVTVSRLGDVRDPGFRGQSGKDAAP